MTRAGCTPTSRSRGQDDMSRLPAWIALSRGRGLEERPSLQGGSSTASATVEAVPGAGLASVGIPRGTGTVVIGCPSLA